MEAITFTVPGIPQPAGSKRGFPVKRKNGTIGVAISDANPKSRVWKQEVAQAAGDIYRGPLLTGPLHLEVTFQFPRPKSHYGTGKNAGVLKLSAPLYHTQKPDSTKLIRGVEDALTGIIWRDDSQVCCQTVNKRWGARAAAGVRIIPLADFADVPEAGVAKRETKPTETNG